MTDQTSPATRESVVAELMSAPSAPVIEGTAAVVEETAEPQEAPEAPVEAADEAPPQDDDEIPADDQQADPDAPDEASEGASEEDEPDQPAIEAPAFWSAEAKARFQDLPYDLQLVVLENEKAASKAHSQRLEDAANARKTAEAEAKALSDLTGRIAQAAEQAEGAFADRWNGMTDAAWLKLSQEDPDQYVRLKAQFDAEQMVVQRAQAAKDEADAANHEQWRTQQVEALKTLAPELVDPVSGAEKLQALGTYLVKNGVAEQDLPRIGALEMSIALKAMQFDQLQSIKAAPKPQAKPGVRPAAAPPPVPTKEREVQRLKNRFAQTGSREDAVALMLAEGS